MNQASPPNHHQAGTDTQLFSGLLAGMVRMLGEDVQAMALHNAYAIDMLAPDTLTRRSAALQASMGSVSTLSSCTSAT